MAGTSVEGERSVDTLIHGSLGSGTTKVYSADVENVGDGKGEGGPEPVA